MGSMDREEEGKKRGGFDTIGEEEEEEDEDEDEDEDADADADEDYEEDHGKQQDASTANHEEHSARNGSDSSSDLYGGGQASHALFPMGPAYLVDSQVDKALQ